MFACLWAKPGVSFSHPFFARVYCGGGPSGRPHFFYPNFYSIITTPQAFPHSLTFETVYIGLGSNLGNRHQYLQRAVDHLCVTPGLFVEKISSIVESPALVLPGSSLQPHYLNAVVACATTLAPVELLTTCLTIEEKLGRIRSELVKWEPRTVDLDLLVWGNRVIQSPPLMLPHPGLGSRAFVLIPLSEIAMDLSIPSPFNCDVRYLLDHCPGLDSTLPTPFQLMISPAE